MDALVLQNGVITEKLVSFAHLYFIGEPLERRGGFGG